MIFLVVPRQHIKYSSSRPSLSSEVNMMELRIIYAVQT
jgi:hypothetical protein